MGNAKRERAGLGELCAGVRAMRPRARCGLSWSGLDIGLSVAVTLCALLLLRVWRYPDVFPGDAARRLCEVVGAWPRFSPQAPLWHLLARTVADGAAGSLHVRLQWIGHLALAASAALLYRIVFLFVVGALDDDAAPRWSAFCVRIAAVGSALFLVVSPPVWRAAQSPEPSILAVLLALGASSAALGYARGREAWRLLLWGFLAGAGLVETPLVCLLLPIWIALFVLSAYSAASDDASSPDDGRGGRMLWTAAAGAFVVGSLCALVAAVVPFRGSEGFVLRGYGRTLNVLLFFARDYLRDLLGALPALGWLVVLLGLLAPWLLVVALARRVQNGELGPGIAFLYGVAAVATALQVAGPPSVKLWSLLREDVFRLGACLVSATTFGLVAAAWLLVSERCRRPVGPVEADAAVAAVGRAGRLLRSAGCLLLGCAMLVTVAQTVPQRRESRDRAAVALLGRFARQTVEDARDCDWVVTDGALDHELRLAAWQAKFPLQPLCILPLSDAWARRTVERRLPDIESRSLHAIGPQALVREWLARRPDRQRRLAAQVAADLWVGSAPLEPCRTLLRPPTSGGFDAEVLHRFWAEAREDLAGASACDDPSLQARVLLVRNHAARIANEVGVRAEDRNDTATAREAYEAARSIDPRNLSARLNLLSLLRRESGRGQRPEGADVLVEEIRGLASAQAKTGWTRMVRLHGTVRDAKAFAGMGAAVLQGLPVADAAANIAAALRLLPSGAPGTDQLQTVLAGLRLQAGDATAGRAAYAAVLAKAPNDVPALLGMAVASASAGGLDESVAWIERARRVRADPLVCDILEAVLGVESGDAEAARTVLRPHVEKRVRNPMVWYLWGKAAVLASDSRSYAQAADELRRISGAGVPTALLAAAQAEHAGDLRTAAEHVRAALASAPANSRLVAHLVRLYVGVGDYEAAQPLAERLLAIEPDNGLARYALGTRLLLLGRHADAEVHLARALEGAPSVASLNNLACARMELGKLDEAQRDAAAATELAPWHPEAWDTLAAVALARRDDRAAEDAARQALALTPDSAAAWLRAGEVAAAQGRFDEARQCLREFEQRPSATLPTWEFPRVARLRERLHAAP